MKQIDKLNQELEAFNKLYDENWNEDFTDNTQLLCMKFFKAGIKVNEKTNFKDSNTATEIINKQIKQLFILNKKIKFLTDAFHKILDSDIQPYDFIYKTLDALQVIK